MKDRVHLATIVVYLFVYLAVFVELLSKPWLVSLVTSCYIVFCIMASISLYLSEKGRRNFNRDIFKRFYFIDKYVSEKIKFQHIFYYKNDISSSIESGVFKALRDKKLIESSDEVVLIDNDRNLLSPQGKRFIIARAVTTVRKTRVEFVWYRDIVGAMQNIQWWVIAQGFVSLDSVVSFILKSPLLLPFIIVPFLRGKYSIIENLRSAYYSSYDGIDKMKHAIAVYESALDELVAQLDSYGIDTSGLKEQRNQIMNINISGGKPILSNIIQGARNIVSRGAANV